MPLIVQHLCLSRYSKLVLSFALEIYKLESVALSFLQAVVLLFLSCCCTLVVAAGVQKLLQSVAASCLLVSKLLLCGAAGAAGCYTSKLEYHDSSSSIFCTILF